MTEEYNIAIVLAAGSGKRMNSSVPKQYLQLQEKPLIYYTLQAFQKAKKIHEILPVTGEDDREYWKHEIVEKYGFTKIKQIVTGGRERYDSVYHALTAIRSCSCVLIHDGARPLVTEEIIERNLESVREWGTACTGVPVKDTIKQCDEKQNVEKTLERNALWQIQTPQSFRFQTIRRAYETMYSRREFDGITDDCMVLERFGTEKVHMVMGSYSNIKATTPEDMVYLKYFLSL